METEVFNSLTRYFQAGGGPAPVIDLLSKNYIALSQVTVKIFDRLTVNLCRFFVSDLQYNVRLDVLARQRRNRS